MHKFRKLLIWKKSILFISHIYKITTKYPENEFYGLVNQIRRAAVSITLNIAEGSGAGSDREFSRFLFISLRSVYEVISGLEIARTLKYGVDSDNLQLIFEADEIGAMISGFIKTLKKSDS